MFQHAFPTMILSLSVYLAVLCAILSVKRRSCEGQAVKLREALNGKIDGVLHPKLPRSSSWLCCLSTRKKVASFWTRTGQVQAAASHSWPALQGHRYLWVQSLSPPYRPLYLVLRSIQQCSPREYLIEINHRWKGPIAVRVRLQMASSVTLKKKIQHGARHAEELTWLLQFSATIRSRFHPKRLQAGSANVDKGSVVAVQANISSSKAVESYNSCRYWGGKTVHPRWREKIIP